MTIGIVYKKIYGLKQYLNLRNSTTGTIDFSDADSFIVNNVSTSVVEVSTDYNVQNQSIILANASLTSITIELPSINNNGRMITIKKIDQTANVINVIPNLISESIDGQNSLIIENQWTSVNFITYSGKWYIV